MVELRGDAEIFGPQDGPQAIAIQSDVDELIYGGAVGGGKTHFLMLDFLYHSAEWNDSGAINGLILRKTYKELADILSKMREVMPRLGWHFKVGEYTWYHPNGARLQLGYLSHEDDVDTYWGAEYTWLAVDEIGQWKEHQFMWINKLKARLRSKHGVRCRYRATANPGGPGHETIKKQYLAPTGGVPMTVFTNPETGMQCMFVPAKFEDNKILMRADPNYLNRLNGAGPAWWVKAIKEGDWNVSPQGNVFTRDYFGNRYKPNQLPARFAFLTLSLDTAYKKGRQRSHSAIIGIGATRTLYYIVYAWHDQVAFPMLKQKTKDVYAHVKPDAVWVENKASGISLVQELESDTRMAIKEVSGDDDKMARAFATTALWDAGKVLLPENAPWVDDFIEEHCRYPDEPDDQVDATSQGLTLLRKKMDKLAKMKPQVPFTGSVWQV